MVTPAHRASHWQLRTRSLDCTRLPLLMGIVNVTPDSFSDGGAWLEPQAAIAHGLQLADEGAAILDVGGESTRPYATPVDQAEEMRRVIAVIRGLCRQSNLPVSIDTSKAAVARAALDEGAEIVNDVTGLAGDPAMTPLVAETAAGVCVMHMSGTPQTMQDDPSYDDVVSEVCNYLCERRRVLVEAGIDAARICLDPGIGFGKTHRHNVELLAGCSRFIETGSPVLIGHSRKGFIGKLLGDATADRTPGNIGVALAVARQRVHVLRVHDVAPVRQALVLFEAAGGLP